MAEELPSSTPTAPVSWVGRWSWNPAQDQVTLDDRAAELVSSGPSVSSGDLLGLLEPPCANLLRFNLARAVGTSDSFTQDAALRDCGTWLTVAGQFNREGLVEGVLVPSALPHPSRGVASKVLVGEGDGLIVTDSSLRLVSIQGAAEHVVPVSAHGSDLAVAAANAPQPLLARFQEVASSRSSASGMVVLQGDPYRFRVSWDEQVDGLVVYLRLLAVASRPTPRVDESAQERLALVLRASEVFSRTLDRTTLLREAMNMVVPFLADWAVVYLEEGGVLRRAQMKHFDPAKEELVAAALASPPVPVDSPAQVARTFRSGSAEIVTISNVDYQRATGQLQQYALVAAQLGAVSAMSVPIISSGRTVGVFLLTSARSDHHYDKGESALAQDIARRMGMSLENAARFEHQRSTAVALQRMVLPDELPNLRRVDLAAHYQPASKDAFVGGDWYDAFPLPDGKVGIAVGDVSGHGVEAAAVMGQMRHSLRAYAVDGSSPSDVVARLDHLVDTLEDVCLTLVYGTLDPVSRTFTWTSAGHPPPLVVRDGVGLVLPDDSSPMLGTGATPIFTESEIVLPAGSVILAYTDGLIERKVENIAVGIERLRALTNRRWEADLPTILQEVLKGSLTGFVPVDDVCLMAVRLRSE